MLNVAPFNIEHSTFSIQHSRCHSDLPPATSHWRWNLLLDLRSLRHDDDSAVGDGEALAIELGIVSDDGVRRHLDAFVDDRPLDLRVAADLDAVHENRFIDVRVRMDADARMKDGAVDRAAADDHAVADERVG